jgi:hypothetical protein
MVTACATIEDNWKSAKEINTVQSYVEFLDDYPESKYAQEARNKLEQAEWSAAKAKNSTIALRRFSEKYPQSRYKDQALLMLQELAWSKAKKSDSVQAYSRFLRKYPNSRYKEHANQALAKLSSAYLMRALEENNVKAVKEALEAGANPNFQFKNQTPLIHLAKEEAARVAKGYGFHSFSGDNTEERRAIAKLLIEAGADVAIKDSSGRTALDYLLEAKTAPGNRDTMKMTFNGRTIESKMAADQELIKLLRHSESEK